MLKEEELVPQRNLKPCKMTNKSFETSKSSLLKSWKSCIMLVASGFYVSIFISASAGAGVRMRLARDVLPI